MTSKLLLLLFLGVVASQVFYQTEDDKYDSTSLSLDALRAAVQCINDRGPCDRTTASFRKHYPLIVQEACKGCSMDQKVALCRFYRRVAEELPDELLATKLRHDPEGKYWDTYIASFSKDC